MFKKATKLQAKLRLTFDGPAGSGKTYSSLVLAKALGGRVAVIDTEHGSASKYASLFDFDAAELPEFSLDTYIKAINAAAAARYDILIIDSLTHAWTGKGGALEQVDRMGGSQGKGFTSGWRTVTPLHTRLIDTMLAFPGHLITTMRTKMEYVLETDSKGRQVPRKVGMAPVQREGMEYEFDVICDLDLAGNVTVGKTRCPELSGSAGLLTHSEVPAMAEKLKAWLSEGAAAPVAPPAAVAPPTPPATAPSTPAPARGDWGANGAPETDLAKLTVALAEAQSKADVDALVPRLRQLGEADKKLARPLFNRRLTEVTRAPQRKQA